MSTIATIKVYRPFGVPTMFTALRNLVPCPEEIRPPADVHYSQALRPPESLHHHYPRVLRPQEDFSGHHFQPAIHQIDVTDYGFETVEAFTQHQFIAGLIKDGGIEIIEPETTSTKGGIGKVK